MAWCAFTAVPADVAGEPRLGRLSPGCLADLVVFDVDPLAVNTDISGCTARATMVAGQVVHDAGKVLA